MDQGAGIQLNSREVWKLWVRTLAIPLLCAIAYVCGQYGVAPGGQYTFYGEETRSFNSATYHWFFQDFGSAYLMILMGIEFGLMAAARIALPIAIVLAAIFWLIRPLSLIARIWIRVDWRWFIVPIAVAWILGLASTILAGVNPGICC